jgi:hypothetical protein
MRPIPLPDTLVHVGIGRDFPMVVVREPAQLVRHSIGTQDI